MWERWVLMLWNGLRVSVWNMRGGCRNSDAAGVQRRLVAGDRADDRLFTIDLAGCKSICIYGHGPKVLVTEIADEWSSVFLGKRVEEN
jgi:hypothetical protein